MKRLLSLARLAAVAASLMPAVAQAQQQHGGYDELIATHARANGVPEALVHRVIGRESRYRAGLVGRGGTIGLMQIKLATARGLGYAGDAEGLRDPNTNLTYGVKYLAGAYHAANFALKRADVFPLAICMSGSYDPAAWDGWGERGETAYFNNPMDYVAHLEGAHLDWLRSQLSLLLICGQGQWEDTTGALDSTRRFAALLQSKEIRCEMDLWGYDVPHDWPSWRAQLAHHLPRFC